jgi:homoserine dehydrogenase
MWKIAIVGFGNVSQGFLRILKDKKESLKERYNFEYSITAIADPVKGSVMNASGLDVDFLMELFDSEGNLKSHPNRTDLGSIDIIERSEADIIVETTITNLETGEPGLSHIKAALGAKKHVVSTNKGPVSVALPELAKLAKENHVEYLFEGVVLSGTPSINLAKEALAGCDIKKVMGIVNGTTNYILTRMEEGTSYEDALKKAQELGYAEADPTGDVEGWDAAVKAQVLANVIMGHQIKIEDVQRTGITQITQEDIKDAAKRGARIKLIAEVEKTNGTVKASVSPQEIPLSHPLANIMDATNALTFTTDHLGDVTIVGPGAGRVETGQALLTDILAIHRKYCKI